MNKDKGRTTRGEVSPDQSQNTILPFTNLLSVGRFLAACLLLLPPAFFLFSCTAAYDSPEDGPPATVSTVVRTRASMDGEIQSLHVFIYDNDSLGRLDSYQSLDPRKGDEMVCASRAGKKLFAAVANLDVSGLDWTETRTFETLSRHVSDFRDEDPDHPVMTAVAVTVAGSGVPVTLALERLMAGVRISSLSCDFTGREYEGAVIENAKAYLINISGRCEIFRREDFTVTEMLNFHQASDTLARQEMVSADIGSIGKTPLSPNFSLFCYPNSTSEDTASTPFTRLVIEGEVNGTKYYWSVNFSPERNKRYDFSLKITRVGTDSPDLPADTAAMEAGCRVMPWNEKDEQTVTFRIKGGKMRERTKSADPAEDIISDLNLFIFNSDDMMEERRYLSGKELESDDGAVAVGFTLLRNARYSVYAVANAGYFLRSITGKDELLSFRYHLVYPDEFRPGIPMGGSLEDFLPGENASPEIDLVRLMAKISLKMDRTDLDRDVKVIVREVTVGGCPNSAAVFRESRAETERGVFPEGYKKSWRQLDPLNADTSLGVSGEVSLYMLENMQGDLLEGVSSQEEKVFPDGDIHAKVCSFLELKMEYYSPTANTRPGEYLIYRFYLGEGPSNFDVERNCHYRYTVKLSGDALSATGWRLDKSALE